jgi:drug/metabolite transporter (DMT)-like permease
VIFRGATIGRANWRVVGGCLAVLLSAICFYLSTATIRWAQIRGIHPAPSFYVLTRLLLGFVIVTALLGIRRRSPRPKKYALLIGRAVANSAAVYCFYQAVQTTTVSHANILNMTYPIFVALITWGVLPEQRDGRMMIALGAAFAGILLILYPAQIAFNHNHLWGIGSGISAALAIVCLNLSRKVHDSETVLFYMFGIGSLMIYAGFHQHMVIHQASDVVYLLTCGAFGIAGQYLITLGFRYVSAVEGSIISSTRILIAAFISPLIAIDPALTTRGWLGALLIFMANVYLAVHKTNQRGHQTKRRLGQVEGI